MKRAKEEQAFLWKEGLIMRGRKVVDVARAGEGRVAMGGVFLGLVVGLVVMKLFFLQVVEGRRNEYLARNNSIRVRREHGLRGVIYDRHGEVLVRNVKTAEGKVGREYVLGEAGAHLLGYVGEVGPDEVGCKEGECLVPGEVVGKMGVEKALERMLRGVEGGKVVEVDARGEVVRELGMVEGKPGEKVVLSVEGRWQKIAWEVLRERLGEEGAGSVVALDLQGKVLALVSYPAFDPNLFTVNKDNKIIQKILNDRKRQYFLNRAISGIYPPGSVFKPVVALAALEEGVLKQDEKIEDVGKIEVNGYEYKNWYFAKYGKTEGLIDVVRALARSNDVFFYKVGERLGVRKLVEWARRVGFGEKGGVELGGEKEGLVPSPLWKERYKGEKWFLGDTYNVSIGQGDLLVTPLQVARSIASIVSGRKCRVSVLRDKDVVCEDLGVKEENRRVVLEGMRQACSPGGTGFTFFDFKPQVLCKTGTAQQGGEKDKPHAWMAVVYPADNPKLVLVVMLEGAGEGSEEAGKVAREILEKLKTDNEK